MRQFKGSKWDEINHTARWKSEIVIQALYWMVIFKAQEVMVDQKNN